MEVSTSSLSTTNSSDMQRDELLARNKKLEDKVGGLETDVIGLGVGLALALAIVVFFVVLFIIICCSKKIRNKIFPE